MTLQLVYSRQARDDLDGIFDFIAADNPHRALSYVTEIEDACEGLCASPMMGRPRDDLLPGLRIFPLWRRIVLAYLIEPDRVRILRVFSAGRDYEAILSER